MTEHVPIYNPHDDPEGFATVQRWRAAASRPFIEDEPTDRPDQACWCTDYHRDVGLNLIYCPRHGREPDPELSDVADDR
jgi:hypothetical protein